MRTLRIGMKERLLSDDACPERSPLGAKSKGCANPTPGALIFGGFDDVVFEAGAAFG